MYDIYLNNERISIAEDTLLSQLLAEKNYVGSGFAVAVNRLFIPRATYKHIWLKPGDKVDIILPMQGG